VVRAELAAVVVKECIEAHIGGAVIVSGGFAEVGKKEMQDELTALAREANFPFLGPNCIGMYSPPHVDTNFVAAERMVKSLDGNVSIVSQSGGILVDQMIKMTEEGVGLSRAVSIGNKALIREVDLLRYFQHRQEDKSSDLLHRGFWKKRGREFLMAAKGCPKPVIVLKAGKTASGMKAVSSHTASLAGDYRVFSEALAQFGVVEAKSETQLINFSEALSKYPTLSGEMVAIITGSGGHGALAADMASWVGLSVPTLPDDSQQEFEDKVIVFGAGHSISW